MIDVYKRQQLPASYATAAVAFVCLLRIPAISQDRKSTRLNSSHANISYAVFCLKKPDTTRTEFPMRISVTQSAGAVLFMLCLIVREWK